MTGAWDAALVIARLDEAGATLMALQVPGCRPAGYRSAMPAVVCEAVEAYGYTEADARLPAPDGRAIGRMDQALSWVRLIPGDRMVFRRIVLMRMMVRPATGRHVMGWRKIAAVLGCSHEAVRGWHELAVGMIVGRLNAPGLCVAAGGRLGLPPGAIARAVEAGAAKPVRRPAARVRELA